MKPRAPRGLDAPDVAFALMATARFVALASLGPVRRKPLGRQNYIRI